MIFTGWKPNTLTIESLLLQCFSISLFTNSKQKNKDFNLQFKIKWSFDKINHQKSYIYRLLSFDLLFLKYSEFIIYSLSQSQPHFGLILYIFYLWYDVVWFVYIKTAVCPKYMIHIAEADLDVLNWTGCFKRETIISEV